jgi:DNA-binding transcriptional regulator YhcF (GntR family)
VDFVLSRSGPINIRDQLATQIEMKIMMGELVAGQKLPSVRLLARRLKIHPNTVSAAYQRLIRGGWIVRERGSGLYVLLGSPSRKETAPGVEGLLRVALRTAFEQGFTADEVRHAVQRWLAAAPPREILVFDTNQETADLLAVELRSKLSTPVSASTFDAPSVPTATSALAVTWPAHLRSLRALFDEDYVMPLSLGIAAEHAEAIVALPKGCVVLVVSHSVRVLEYALWFVSSRRGDVDVKCHLLSQTAEWRALSSVAELVFADLISAESVRRAGARNVQEFRLVTEQACTSIRQRLAFAPPRLAVPHAPQLPGPHARAASVRSQ